MRKKVLAAMMSGLMVLSLTACGSKDSDNQSSKEEIEEASKYKKEMFNGKLWYENSDENKKAEQSTVSSNKDTGSTTKLMGAKKNSKKESEDIEETKEESKDTEETKEESKDTVSLDWKQAYLDYLVTNENHDYGYSLAYIDEDDVPELLIDTCIAATGIIMCTYGGTNVCENFIGQGILYAPAKNLYQVSGGNMDRYYDKVCKLVNGVPQVVYDGEWGLLESNDVSKLDKARPIDSYYQYSWNGNIVSEGEYYNLLADNGYYDETVIPGVYGNEFTTFDDVTDTLKNSMDIVKIKPYANNNGYMDELSMNMIVTFDGIQESTIHFTLRSDSDDEMLASGSATIIDSSTAKFSNDRSSITFKFNPDYKYLEIEGYIGDNDLTGKYQGMWG